MSSSRLYATSLVQRSILLLFVIALAACAGQRSAVDNGLPAPASGNIAGAPPTDALPELPPQQPVDVNRQGSFTNVRAYYGNGIFQSSGDNIFAGRSIVMISTPPDGLHWAEYAFSNLGGYQPSKLELGLDVSA